MSEKEIVMREKVLQPDAVLQDVSFHQESHGAMIRTVFDEAVSVGSDESIALEYEYAESGLQVKKVTKITPLNHSPGSPAGSPDAAGDI